MFDRPKGTFWREVGSCFSRLLNVTAFGGNADLSLSSRAHGARMLRLERFIDRLFGAGHCKRWWNQEVRRAHQIVDEADAP